MFDRRLFEIKNMTPTLKRLAFLTVVQAFAVLGQGIFLAQTIVVLWQKKPLSDVWLPLALFALTFIVRQLMTVLKNKLMSTASSEIVSDLRQRLLVQYEQSGPRLIAQNGTGASVATLFEGLDNVQNYCQLVLIKLFDLSVTPWLILIYIAFLKWQEALFLLLIFPVIIIFFIILGLAAQIKADAEYANFRRLNNHFVDTLRGLATLKQLGISKSYADEIYTTSENYRRSTMSTLRIAMTSTFALDFFTTLSIAVIAVFLGMDLLNGQLTLYPALAILILAPEYFLPLRNFADDYHATLDGKNALADILNLLAQPVPTDTQVLTLKQWSDQDQLSLKNVSVAYDQTTVLKQLNLTLTGYEKVAIVGLSGSGKTTLLNALGGFLPLVPGKGEAAINEQVLPHFAQKDWQKQFFYLPQQPYIFAASLKDNLTFYTPNATLPQIKKAVKQAGLTSLVKQFPDGLSTKIGEGGQSLSGGQAQRVALARVLLDNQRHVMMLDEPTAHLDIETESELKEAILPTFKNRLVIFATHRLHWLAQMDYVIVMDHGKIVEQGEMTQLLKQADSRLNQLRQKMGHSHETI